MLGGEITTACDVYALGVLLYVLLSGRHPTHAEGMTPAARVRTLLETEAVRLSAMPEGSVTESQAIRRNSTPERLRRALGGDLENIVAKALRKQQAERYTTVAALAEDLRAYLAREPVSARPDTLGYRARLFVRRHRVGVSAAAAVFLALIAGVIGTTWQAIEAGRQRDAARFQAARAEASSQFMSLMLEEVGPGDRPPTLSELLDHAQDLLDKQYGGDPRFVATMLIELSHRYLDMGRNDRALDALGRSTAIARTLQDDALLARSLCASAYTRFLAATPALAEPELQQADAALARVRNVPVDLQVDCLRARADLALDKKDQPAALALLQSAHDLQERSGDTRGLQYTSVLVDMGGIYLRSGRLPEAYATTLQVLAAFDRNGRAGTMGKVTSQANLAVILNSMGEVLPAAQIQEQVMQRTAALLASDSSRVSYAINYANTLVRLDHSRRAWDLLQGLTRKSIEDNGVYWTGGYEFQCARALFALGDAAGAEQHLRETERLWRQDPVRNTMNLRNVAIQRIRMNLQQGDTPAARERVDALLQEIRYPEQHSGAGVRNALIVAATVYLRAGEAERAQSYAIEAYEIARRVARLPDASADVGEAAFVLAGAHEALGHTEAARPLLGQAVKSLTGALGVDHPQTRAAIEARKRVSPDFS
jgi:serine/threonine-protein kinase